VIRRALERLLSQPELGRSWFIRQDDELAGYVNLTFGFDLEYGGRDAWITDFYVRPSHQGRGIGKQALSLLEPLAREHGAGAIHLMVRQDNEVAQKLYRSRGFAPNPRVAWIKSLR
jgi:ribosomal protein S18 acetylase RimI-like enzyme